MDSRSLWGFLRVGLGAGRQRHEITTWQMGGWAFLLYLAAILLVRFGSSRFMGRTLPWT